MLLDAHKAKAIPPTSHKVATARISTAWCRSTRSGGGVMHNILGWCWYQTRHDGVDTMPNILKSSWYPTRHEGIDMMPNILKWCWYQTRHDGTDRCSPKHRIEGRTISPIHRCSSVSDGASYGGAIGMGSLREKDSSMDSHFPRKGLFMDGEWVRERVAGDLSGSADLALVLGGVLHPSPVM